MELPILNSHLGMDSSCLNNIGKLTGHKDSSGKMSSNQSLSIYSSVQRCINPVDGTSKDFSECEVSSSHPDDYETTLRAFELSQISQKQKKPQTSNFIGEFDNQMIPKDRLSVGKVDKIQTNAKMSASKPSQMITIQEDDQSSKSQDDESISRKSITTFYDQGDTKDGKDSFENSCSPFSS